MDPLLYNGKDALNAEKILNFQKMKDKMEKETPVSKSKFLEDLNSRIYSTIPDNYKSKINSDAFYNGISRKEILEETENSPEKRKLYEASKEFESFFVEKMFLEMQKNIPKNEMFHGGYAEDLFKDMLLTERVRKLSGNTEFGLAEKMYQQLSVLY